MYSARRLFEADRGKPSVRRHDGNPDRRADRHERERLAELKNTEDWIRARRLLGQIIIIGTYVKRKTTRSLSACSAVRSHIQELRLCLNRSVENLNLCGVDCKALVKGDDQLSFEQAAKGL